MADILNEYLSYGLIFAILSHVWIFRLTFFMFTYKKITVGSKDYFLVTFIFISLQSPVEFRIAFALKTTALTVEELFCENLNSKAKQTRKIDAGRMIGKKKRGLAFNSTFIV